MSNYTPSDDLKEYLYDCNIMSYRLVDGSYIIAEEYDVDDSTNVVSIVAPLLIEFSSRSGRSYMQPWIMTPEDELVYLSGDKIVARAETTLELKLHYHKYFLVEKLQHVLTDKEIHEVIKQIFKPEVDNLDFKENYENFWENDNSINDVHLKWREKYKNNKNK